MWKLNLVEIIGFVGNPESSKKKGAQQFFFANGRYMRHPLLRRKRYKVPTNDSFPDGEQVPFFLQILINPCRIDVNIHPTKTEIKFEDEQPIWQILRAAVRETLGASMRYRPLILTSKIALIFRSFKMAT